MRQRGFVLVFVAGILGLLSLLALAFLQNFSLSTAPAQQNARLARLAAASGMQYAESRLRQDDAPRRLATPESRGDDWTSRDLGLATSGWGLATSSNPSYAHGEPWADTDGDGRFIPGEFWTDRDANGRFTPCSGRLRGGSGLCLFALKIESPCGKIPVNAGLSRHLCHRISSCTIIS